MKQNTTSPKPSFIIQGTRRLQRWLTVRTLAIMLDFRRRNYGPRAVLADFASNPITVLNPRFAGEQSWLLQHGTVRLSGIIQAE